MAVTSRIVNRVPLLRTPEQPTTPQQPLWPPVITSEQLESIGNAAQSINDSIARMRRATAPLKRKRIW